MRWTASCGVCSKNLHFFSRRDHPPSLFLTPESCGSAACPPRHLGLDFWQSIDNERVKQDPPAFFVPAIGAQIPVDGFGLSDNVNLKQDLGEPNGMFHAYQVFSRESPPRWGVFA
jgi:hypothetical protein